MENFQKLSPIITAKESESNKIYQEAFDFVFGDPDIRNIAVSGLYGAGKSSVFNSYMKNCKLGEKIIRISLAHFEQLGKSGNGTKKEDEVSLEAKIINQLIHQIDPKKIKKTRFIARKRNRFIMQILESIGISLSISILFTLIFNEKIKELSEALIFTPFKSFFSANVLVLSVIVLFVLLSLFIWTIISHIQGRDLLKKISIKNISVEVSDEKTESFFDRYLTEIRYLFDNCGSKIIAIDDIDRYYSNSIFEKIRELNTVINYNGDENPIRFFYIIKDDLFKSKDRTKFFDFIIPVIPIMDSSNSYSLLINLLKKEVPKLDNSFLRGLSIYIDEMRVLKNIINEFLIFHKQLIKQDLDPNKLLAFITYKNLFPHDFYDLQIGKGYLFTLIKSREEFLKEVVKDRQEQVEKLNKKIEDMEKENARSIDELSALYFTLIPRLYFIDDNEMSSFGSQLKLLNYLNSKQGKVEARDVNGNSITNVLVTNYKNLQSNSEYIARKELLEEKLRKGIQYFENEKVNIEHSIQSIVGSYSISQFVNSENLENFLNLKCIQKSGSYPEIKEDLHFPIVAFLVRKGMIDGYYQDYLTYFYESDLKIQDQLFVRSFFDEKPLPENHELSNPKTVLEIIERISNNNPALLNKSLFFYVIDEMKEEDTQRYIELMEKYLKDSLIKNYLWEGKQIHFLVIKLDLLWPSFYLDVNATGRWPVADKDRFIRLQLENETSEVFANIYYNNHLEEDLIDSPDLFKDLKQEYQERVVDNLTQCNVRFRNVGSLNAPVKLFNDIYKCNLYQLNIANICFWLGKKYGYSEKIDYDKLLSIVISKPQEPLSIYALSNADEMLKNIMSDSLKVKFNNDQQTIHKILKSVFSLNLKKEYLARLIPVIESIQDIQDIETIKLILNGNQVKFSANNLIELFLLFEKTFPTEFIEYLTAHEKDAVKEKIDTRLYPKETVIDEFFRAVLADSSLNQKITTTLLSVTNIKIEDQSEIMSKDKMAALIFSGSLVMNKENLVFIRKNYSDLILKFEKIHLEEFKAILDLEQATEPDEIVNLLESDLNGSEQISLLSRVHVNIPYKKTYQFSGVKKYIIRKLLDKEDIKSVFRDKAAQEKPLLSVVVDQVIDNIAFIMREALEVPYTVFRSLSEKGTVTKENLIVIFSNSLAIYEPEQIKKCILDLSIAPLDEMYMGKRPQIEETPISQKISSALTKKGIAKVSPKNRKIYLRKKYQ